MYENQDYPDDTLSVTNEFWYTPGDANGGAETYVGCQIREMRDARILNVVFSYIRRDT